MVGTPPSGTTLTEQILAAHPLGHGCGELPDIALIANQLAAMLPADDPATVPAGLLAEAATRYLRAATRKAPPQARCLVDKAPLNFFHLGLVARLFPRARVIWCRRDPRDIAVSVYAENFALDERLATDLGDIGHYINLQTRLMRHWQAQLPLPVMELVYEELALDPEPVARRLVAFAGLEWDPSCLEFHRSERGVQTPSRWQVRQPIYTRSIGRWHRHAEALAPLLATLDADAYPGVDGPAESAQASTPSARASSASPTSQWGRAWRRALASASSWGGASAHSTISALRSRARAHSPAKASSRPRLSAARDEPSSASPVSGEASRSDSRSPYSV